MPAVALATARTTSVLTTSAVKVVDTTPSFTMSSICCSPFPNTPAEVSKTTGTPSGTGLPEESSIVTVMTAMESPFPTIKGGSADREIRAGTAAIVQTITGGLCVRIPSAHRADPTFCRSPLTGRSGRTLTRRPRVSAPPGNSVPRSHRTTRSDSVPLWEAKTSSVYWGSVSETVASVAAPSPMFRSTSA